MPIKVDTSGFERLRKKLAEAAKSESVLLPELMPESFMREYTEFETLQDMFDAGGVESADDLKSDKWHSFVAEHTQFASWMDMIKKAGVLRLKNKLNL